MPLLPDDPSIEAIAERVRSVVLRQLGSDVASVVRSLGVPEEQFRLLVEQRDQPIDASFLLDALAAMARVLGLDAQWGLKSFVLTV